MGDVVAGLVKHEPRDCYETMSIIASGKGISLDVEYSRPLGGGADTSFKDNMSSFMLICQAVFFFPSLSFSSLPGPEGNYLAL